MTGTDGVDAGTEGSFVVMGMVGAAPLDVDVPLVVSGLGMGIDSGGREVTSVDPPVVMVTGTDDCFVVTGAGPLVAEVPWLAVLVVPVDTDDKLKDEGSAGLLWLTVGNAILVVRVPRLSERVTPIESGGRLKLDWTGTLGTVVGTATLVVSVPRLSEIVTPIESGGRLKLVSVGLVRVVVGTGTAVVTVKPLLEMVIGIEIGTTSTVPDEPEDTLWVVAVTGTPVVKVVELPDIVTGTETIGKLGSGFRGLAVLESVIGALAVKVVSLLEAVMGTETIGIVPLVLLGILTDTGTDAVKVPCSLVKVIGTGTTDTVEGITETGLVPVVDADPEAAELLWPLERLTEAGKGTSGAVVGVSEGFPVLDDP